MQLAVFTIPEPRRLHHLQGLGRNSLHQLAVRRLLRLGNQPPIGRRVPHLPAHFNAAGRNLPAVPAADLRPPPRYRPPRTAESAHR